MAGPALRILWSQIFGTVFVKLRISKLELEQNSRQSRLVEPISNFTLLFVDIGLSTTRLLLEPRSDQSGGSTMQSSCQKPIGLGR
jgi:hypothetical protein